MTKKEIIETLRDYYNRPISESYKKELMKRPKQELKDWLDECELCFGR